MAEAGHHRKHSGSHHGHKSHKAHDEEPRTTALVLEAGHSHDDNVISTAKYTLLTFLPISLFEQCVGRAPSAAEGGARGGGRPASLAFVVARRARRARLPPLPRAAARRSGRGLARSPRAARAGGPAGRGPGAPRADGGAGRTLRRRAADAGRRRASRRAAALGVPPRAPPPVSSVVV